MSKRLLTGLKRYADPPYSNSSLEQYSETQSEIKTPNGSEPILNDSYPFESYGFINEASTYVRPKQIYSHLDPSHKDQSQHYIIEFSKSNQVDMSKLPRPILPSEISKTPKYHATSPQNNPPPSYTSFIVKDEGNTGPRYIRSTFNKFPKEESLVNGIQIPMGIICQPFADQLSDEESVSIVDYGEIGPFRCARCRAYVNPNWSFIQNGNFAVCNLCLMKNETPKEYFCPLDENGNRQDKFEKPELNKGIYEFIVQSSYQRRQLVTPNIVLCIEASSICYHSGVFHQIFSSLESLLEYIPTPEQTNICIVTYDNAVNFFKIPDDLTKQMTILRAPDIDIQCLPLPKSHLFFNLKNDKDKINYLLDKIVKFYESNESNLKKTHGTCLGTALINSCEMLVKEGGRVLLFTGEAPTHGLGKIHQRDDYKLYGTEKEKELYIPQSNDYKLWAKKWLESRISVDIFCFAPEYFDITTIGEVSGLTGGNIYYYRAYNFKDDGEKLHYDLARNLTRYYAYDVVMTIRTSQGISFLDYLTPTGRHLTSEIEFSNVDADTVFNIFLRHNGKIIGNNVHLQIAILYTTSFGQRVIRVLNFCALTTDNLTTLFDSCDVEAVAQLIIKRNIINITSTSIPDIRKNIFNLISSIFYYYRYNCVKTSPRSQLILPQSLKELPIYILGLFKSFMLRIGGDSRPDDRAYDMFRFIKTPLNILSNSLYPKIYALHNIWTENEFAPGNVINNKIVLGTSLAASQKYFDNDGLYIIDNGEFLFIYVKMDLNPLFIDNLFGGKTFEEISELTILPDNFDSEYFIKVSNIIEELRKRKNASYQPVRIVTEKSPSEPNLLNLLVEDERLGDSYLDFLYKIHKFIQEKLGQI